MTTEELMIELVKVAAIKWRILKDDCDRTRRRKSYSIHKWAEDRLVELDGVPDQEIMINKYREEFKNERLKMGLPV